MARLCAVQTLHSSLASSPFILLISNWPFESLQQTYSPIYCKPSWSEVRPDTPSTVELRLRNTGLRRMGGSSDMLYGDILGHFSYCQGHTATPAHWRSSPSPAVTGKWFCSIAELCQPHGAEEQGLPAWRWVGVRWAHCWEAREGRGSTTAFPDIMGRLWDSPSVLHLNISRRMFREGMRMTVKHGERWCRCRVSLGDTLNVIVRTWVQSAGLVTCARSFEGCILP